MKEGKTTPVMFALQALDDLVEQVTNGRVPPDRRGSYAAVREWVRFLEEETDRLDLPRANIVENLERLRYSMAAVLGQGPNDGHVRENHVGWAIGAMWGLQTFCTFGPVLPKGWKAGG